MLKRIVKSPIFVVRDGKQVAAPVGEVFEFTDAEVKELNEINPASIDVIVLGEAEQTPAKAAKV